MRNIAFVSILLLATNFTFAQNEPEDYVATFFNLLGQGKISEAIHKIPTNNKFDSDTSYTSKLLTKLELLSKNSGEYCGYELIEKEEVSESYIVYTYFIKYMNVPQQIQFIFYKPKDAWQINHIALSGQARQAANRRPGFRK